MLSDALDQLPLKEILVTALLILVIKVKACNGDNDVSNYIID